MSNLNELRDNKFILDRRIEFTNNIRNGCDHQWWNIIYYLWQIITGIVLRRRDSLACVCACPTKKRTVHFYFYSSESLISYHSHSHSRCGNSPRGYLAVPCNWSRREWSPSSSSTTPRLDSCPQPSASSRICHVHSGNKNTCRE